MQQKCRQPDTKTNKRRRRRTDPNSVFEMDSLQHAITERKQDERIEALMKQFVELVQTLNEDVAVQKAF